MTVCIKWVKILLICICIYLVCKFVCGFIYGFLGYERDNLIMFIGGYIYGTIIMYLFPELFYEKEKGIKDERIKRTKRPNRRFY